MNEQNNQNAQIEQQIPASEQAQSEQKKSADAPKKSSKKWLWIIGIILVLLIISFVFKGGREEVASKKETKVKGVYVKKEQVKGEDDASLTITLFDDFECPFCGAFEGTNKRVMDMMKQRSPDWEPVMPNLIKEYVNTGKVKLVYKHFPLSFHKNATPAAEAAECAGAQGKFWQMHDKIFEMNGEGELNVEKFRTTAQTLGLDMEFYNACMNQHMALSKIQDDIKEGEAAGVNGTPAAIVGQEVISGAVPYSEFKKAVEAAFGK